MPVSPEHVRGRRGGVRGRKCTELARSRRKGGREARRGGERAKAVVDWLRAPSLVGLRRAAAAEVGELERLARAEAVGGEGQGRRGAESSFQDLNQRLRVGTFNGAHGFAQSAFLPIIPPVGCHRFCVG